MKHLTIGFSIFFVVATAIALAAAVSTGEEENIVATVVGLATLWLIYGQKVFRQVMEARIRRLLD